MSFETAQSNMNAAITQQQSAPTPSAPAQQSNQSADIGMSQAAEADQKAVQDLIDIDGLEKVKFKGKEWTPEELQKSIMMQQDYSKKTANLAREREYTANLRADLAKVRKDPSLAGEFKRLYPEAYHGYLELVLEQAEQQDNQSSQVQNSADSQIAKQLSDLQKRLENYERGIGEKEHAAKVSQIQQELDVMFKGLEKKYDFAVEEAVLTKAEALIAKGYEMTPGAWERLYKSNHEQNMARAQKWFDKKTQEQLKASQEGGDIARGGGIPSPGKRKMSLSDATEHMINSLSKG